MPGNVFVSSKVVFAVLGSDEICSREVSATLLAGGLALLGAAPPPV